MTQKIDKAYGPGLHHLSSLGWLTRLVLWFYPLIVHETPDGIVVYKIRKNVMYVFGVVKKPTQADRAGLS